LLSTRGMRLRRALRVAAFTVPVTLAAHGARGDAGWQVEAAGTGGSASAQISHDADVRVAYGVGGVEVRYSAARAAEGARGLAFDAGGLAEVRSTQSVGCVSCGAPETTVFPLGRARAGYDAPTYGVRAGVLVWTVRFGDVQAVPLPDVDLRVGRLDGTRVMIGVGAYDLATYARPGFYAGLLAPASRGWEIGGYVGLHLGPDATGGMRESLTMRAPLGERLWAHMAFALTEYVYVGADVLLGVGGSL